MMDRMNTPTFMWLSYMIFVAMLLNIVAIATLGCSDLMRFPSGLLRAILVFPV